MKNHESITTTNFKQFKKIKIRVDNIGYFLTI